MNRFNSKAILVSLALILILGGPRGNLKAADPGQGVPPAPQEPGIVLIPENARPGEPVTIGYCGNIAGPAEPGLQAVLMDEQGRRLSKAAFFSVEHEEGEEELKAAILAIPATARPGNGHICIESANGLIRELPYTITGREFTSETILLNQDNTDLRTKPDPQKTAEAERLWAILSRTGKDAYCYGPFLPPVASTRRTSFYGDRRIYQYIDGSKDTSIHAGIDFGVPKGTEVRACAPGKVVFAGLRIVTGNSVILEHLPGVYSLYYHMDTILVHEGAVISGGDLVGLSGSTGLATGPHLHWEIRVSGEYADPDAFLSRAVLDKKDIFNKMRKEPIQ